MTTNSFLYKLLAADLRLLLWFLEKRSSEDFPHPCTDDPQMFFRELDTGRSEIKGRLVPDF